MEVSIGFLYQLLGQEMVEKAVLRESMLALRSELAELRKLLPAAVEPEIEEGESDPEGEIPGEEERTSTGQAENKNPEKRPHGREGAPVTRQPASRNTRKVRGG